MVLSGAMYGISHHQKCFRSSKYCIAARKIQLTTGGNHCCQVPAMDTFSQISQKISKCSIWKHFGDPNRVKGAVSREKWTVATGVGVPQTEVLA